MKKYYVMSDGKSVVKATFKPVDSICELDAELKGKAFKVIEELDDFGFPVKKAVLDADAEAARLADIAAKEQAEINNRAAFKQAVDMYKALDPDTITNLAEAKQYLKQLNVFLKTAFKNLIN